LEAHPEFVGSIVYEQDGEDAVVDDCPDKVGDSVEQGIEIERSVERVGQPQEEVQLQRLDADVRLERVAVQERTRSRVRGAIVAFEGDMFRFGRGF